MMSKRQIIGVGAILVLLATVVGGLALHGRQPRAPGIVLREAPASGPSVSPSRIDSISPRRVDPDRRASAPGTPVHTQTPAEATGEAPAPAPAADIVVHVAGAVRKPGVYRLRPNARNDDALKAAGGPTSDANTDSINLAAHPQDGQQIYFKSRKEQPEGGALEDPIPAVSLPPSSPSSAIGKVTPLHRPSAHAGNRNNAGGKPSKLTDPRQGKININVASAEELQRIPGIGPAMAEKVIAYRRENHGFQGVEDLMQVSGIGEKKFARMQPFIRVR